MDFSDGWKAYFPIDFVPCAPLLLPESVVRSTIGPLLFSPSPGTLRTVSPSPSTSAAQVKSDDFSSNNNLGFIKCPDNDILLFFPTGDNLHKLGSAKLSLKVDAIPEIFDPSDCDCRSIVKIMVSSVWTPAKFGTLGYLSACTTHSVHWFKIDWDRKEHRHVLVNLGSEQFDASVLHACWNPHAPRESLVLLDSGEFILFGWWDIPDITRFDVEWKDSDLSTLTSDTKWLSCEFGWHPRIFVIACSDVVYEVNGIWNDKYTARILAKIESFADMQLAGQEELLAGTHEPDEFVTFCRAGPRGFNFTIASRYGLYLIDTRQPLSPVLQWCHHLDCRPTYMQVFQLSELRSKADRDEYEWATQSGFAILLGSFLDDDFGFFLYGPPVPAPPKSLASKVADLCHTLYAWGRPSGLSLSGHQCCCGDCLIREESSNAGCPKRKITGFCFITEDLLNIHIERGVGCSFGLIRLLPSGKIESQMYNASWELEHLEPAESPDEDFHMDLFQSDDIYKKNKRLELDNLLPYLHGDLLAKVIKEGAGCMQPFTQEKYRYLHDHLKAASVGQIGSLPDIVKVLTSVSVPMSIKEIAVSRMWTGLSISALQLGFSSYPELPQFEVNFNEVSMDFLHIPKTPQLPPFLLRKPSQEVQPGDDLLGPVLPLPVLVNLRKVEKEMGTSAADKNEDNEFSLTHQCNEIMRVAMGLPGSSAELPDSHAVSLDDDMDGSSSVFQEVKSLVFYKPTSFTSENRHSVEQPVPEDTSATFIMKANKSDVEMFDDLCPIELKFDDSPSKNFGKEELEALKLLKRRILSWQRKYKPYQALVGRQA